MSLAKSLAIALVLSANTGKASASVDKFATEAEKRLAKINKKADDRMSSGMSLMKSGAAMITPIVLAAKSAADLEDKIADVAKITGDDFGGKGFKDLSKQAMEVGKYLGRDAVEAADMMAELAAGGVARDRLAAVAKSAGEVGVAFGITAGEAGKSFMIIQNALNLTEQDTMSVMDAMNAATNKFGGKASELLNFMAQGGASVAKTLNISAVSMQGIANSFQVVGVSSSEAATTMERFQKAVLTNAKAAGIFNKAGGGSAGVMAILEKAKASGNAAKWLLGAGFGEYSTKLAQLANNMDSKKGVKAQTKYLNVEENVKGSAHAEFENRQKTTNEQLKKLKSSAGNAGITIGSVLLPHVNKLIDRLMPLIEAAGKWVEKNSKTVETILQLVAVLGVVKIALGAVRFAVGALTKLFLASPLTLAIYAIAIGAFLIIKYWDQIKAFFSKLFDKVRSIIKQKWEAIKNVFLNYTPVGLVIKHWDSITAWFGTLWENVKAGFQVAWEAIKALLLNYTPIGLIIKHWEPISQFFVNLWEDVKAGFMRFINWFVDKWNWVKKNIINPIASVFGGGDDEVTTPEYTPSPGLPAPVPLRSGSGGGMSYSPVFHVAGNLDNTAANKIISQGRKDFSQKMDDYKNQQDRYKIF